MVPGFVDAPMAQTIPAHVKNRIINQIPMERFGLSFEVVSFLLSPRSGYVIGESVTVSGMICL